MQQELVVVANIERYKLIGYSLRNYW